MHLVFLYVTTINPANFRYRLATDITEQQIMLPSSGPTRTFVLTKHHIIPALTSDLIYENIQTIGLKESAFVLERGKFSSLCSV